VNPVVFWCVAMMHVRHRGWPRCCVVSPQPTTSQAHLGVTVCLCCGGQKTKVWPRAATDCVCVFGWVCMCVVCVLGRVRVGVCRHVCVDLVLLTPEKTPNTKWDHTGMQNASTVRPTQSTARWCTSRSTTILPNRCAPCAHATPQRAQHQLRRLATRPSVRTAAAMTTPTMTPSALISGRPLLQPLPTTPHRLHRHHEAKKQPGRCSGLHVASPQVATPHEACWVVVVVVVLQRQQRPLHCRRHHPLQAACAARWCSGQATHQPGAPSPPLRGRRVHLCPRDGGRLRCCHNATKGEGVVKVKVKVARVGEAVPATTVGVRHPTVAPAR